MRRVIEEPVLVSLQSLVIHSYFENSNQRYFTMYLKILYKPSGTVGSNEKYIFLYLLVITLLII